MYYTSVIYTENDTDYLAFRTGDEYTVCIVGDIVADGFNFNFTNCDVYTIHHDYGGISQQNRTISVQEDVSGTVTGGTNYNLYSVSSVGLARRNEYYEIAESKVKHNSILLFGIFTAVLLCVVALWRRKK